MNTFFILTIFALSFLTSANSTPDQHTGRIINGQDSSYVPYVAQVWAVTDGYQVHGGGSFITRQHVLTSGSLVHNMSWWYVEFGSIFYVGNIINSFNAALHPEYDPYSFENNIGVLFLEKAASEVFITPIPLPMTTNTPYVNEQGKLSGFGPMESGSSWVMNRWKQTGFFRRIEDSRCQEVLAKNDVHVFQTNFCAMDLDYEASICYGDHGSGLTLFIDGVNTLVGVVSVFTNMCHRNYPTVFTKVGSYTGWINVMVDQMQPPPVIEE